MVLRRKSADRGHGGVLSNGRSSRVWRASLVVGAALAAVTALTAAAVHGAVEPTKTWDGGGDGVAWDDPLNWSGDTLPGTGDHVQIGTSFAVVHSSGITRIKSLESAGTLTLSGGALELTDVANPSTATSVTLSVGAELTGSATLTISNSLTWSGGIQSGAGRTTIAPGAVLTLDSGGGVVLDTRTLRNEGTATVQGNGIISADYGARLENAANASFTLAGDAFLFPGGVGATPVLENEGTFTKSGGLDSSIIGFELDNEGSVTVNSGVLSLEGGGGATPETGDFVAGTGATLDFTFGDYTLGAGSSVSGTGAISLLEANVSFGGAYDVLGTTAINGGTASFDGSASAAALEQWGGTLTGAGTLAVTGSYLWVAGTQAGSGTTTIGPGATLDIISGSEVTLDARTLRNQGIASITSGGIDARNGARIENASQFTLEADVGLSRSSGTAVLDNDGTFTKSGGTGVSPVGLELDNDGAVTASSGTLSLRGGDGSATQMGTFGGSGATASVDFGLGAYDLAAGAAFTGRVRLAGATVTVPAAVTVPVSTSTTTTLSGGVLTGAGTLLVNGTLRWAGGTQAGTGKTTIASGGTLTLDAAGAVSLDTRTLRNEGSASVVGAGGILASNGSRLENAAGASFAVATDADLLAGAGAVPRLDNDGAFTKSGGGGITAVGFQLDNDGGITANAGTVSLQGGDGGTTETGSFVAGSGGKLDFAEGTYVVGVGSSTGGAGNLAVSGATVSFGGTYNVTGTTQLSAGSASLSGSASTSALQQSGGTLTGAGTLAVSSSYVWTAGKQSGAGTTSIASGATLTVNTATFVSLERTLRNEGSATVAGTGSFFVDNGARLENASGATFALLSDIDLIWSVGAAPRIDNDGTFRKSAGSGTSSISTEFQNDGVIEAAAGTLSIDAPGGLLNYASATKTLTGGEYLVSATLRFANADVVTNAATIELDGPASSFQNQTGQNALRNLATNTAAGDLTFENGRNLTTPAGFANAGGVTIGANSSFASTGTYTQTGGFTLLQQATSTLTATGASVNVAGGQLLGIGTAGPSVPASRRESSTSPGLIPRAAGVLSSWTSPA